MSRALSLSFTFELTIGDQKYRATNRPGDVVRLREILGGGSVIDEALAAGGVDAYDILFRFAWQAARHLDDHAGITWDEFIDGCEEWSMIDEPARPTVGAPSNAPSSSSPSLPTLHPATGGGSTPT